METKKNKHADLEHVRLRIYMMSLIVVLAALFVALEYESGASGSDNDDFDIDSDEFELAPLKREEERIALALKQEPKPAPEKIEVVEKTEELNRMDMPEDRKDEQEGKTEQEEKKKEKDPMVAPAENALDNNPLNFRVVEDLPQFPGGAMELMKWLTANLKYPHKAQKRKVEGKVIVQFIVAADGTMTNLKVVKALDPACDNEALRVMKMMPKWKPGMQDGKPCRTMVCIPIVFKL